MNALIINETTATPKVFFDVEQGVFEIKGCSRPEDVRDFYQPIIQWLSDLSDGVDEKLIEQFKSEALTFNFIFDYFNSSSAKFILDILVLINQMHSKGLSLRIDWHFDENDEDMKEVGEELSEVVDFPFEYIMIPGKPIEMDL